MNAKALPIHDACQSMPLHDTRCVFVDMPVLSDESAWQLTQWLHRLTQTCDDFYCQQILCAHDARQEQHDRLRHELRMLNEQQPLPFEEDNLT